MRTIPLLTAAALVGCLAGGTGAAAAVQVHAVSGGESASAIAARYYGDKELGDLLLRYNGRSGTVIRAGEKLRIPICEVHRVGAGDTWSVLSTKYLGKTSKFATLAALNGLKPDHVLRPGEPIVIPVVISHKLGRGESLASLAERFYRDPKAAGVLQTFNNLDDPRRLSVGQTVEIPLVSFVSKKNRAAGILQNKPAPAGPAAAGRKDTPKTAAAKAPAQEPKATAARQPAASAARKTPAPALPAVTLPQVDTSRKAPEASPTPAAAAAPQQAARPRDLDKEIAEASKAFAEGDYARARHLLESLHKRARAGGSDEEKARVASLLAFVYIAYDMNDEACTAYRSFSSSTRKPGLDPDLVSPKIRDTLSRCKKG